MLLTPGSRLGTYEIVAPLGAGGMGEVYRARDLRLRRDVALKVLPTDVASDPDRLARFEREARIVAGDHAEHPSRAVPVIAAVSALAELPMPWWLFFAGVNQQRWRVRALAAAEG